MPVTVAGDPATPTTWYGRADGAGSPGFQATQADPFHVPRMPAYPTIGPAGGGGGAGATVVVGTGGASVLGTGGSVVVGVGAGDGSVVTLPVSSLPASTTPATNTITATTAAAANSGVRRPKR